MSIIKGDCVSVLRSWEDEVIYLTITSPPYDHLRDYNGYSFDFENIAKELFRVTKKGGVVVWVVKDSVSKGNRSLNSFRQAIYFQEIGFNIYDVIIYLKSTCGNPHKNRYRDSFEYMFVLSKGLPKTINLLRDRKNKYGGQTSRGKHTKRETSGELTNRKKIIVSEYGVRYNIWKYSTGMNNSTSDKIAFEHPAIFPEKLAEDHIKSWSNEGDTILDPMCGSGTTCKMALLNNRKYIGIDASEEYCKISKERIKSLAEQRRLTEDKGK